MYKCRICGLELKHYDYVRRLVRIEYGRRKKIFVERRYCKQCRTVVRVLPDTLYPYKQYERKIIDGFVSGAFDIFMSEYEDYPAEITVKRWINARKFNSS